MNRIDNRIRTTFPTTLRSPSTDIVSPDEPPSFLGRYKAPKQNRRCISLPSIIEPANDPIEPLYIEIQGQSRLITLSELHYSYSISHIRSIAPTGHAKEPKYTPSQIFRTSRTGISTSMAAQNGSEVDIPPPIPPRNPARLSRGSAAEIPPPIPPRNSARLSRGSATEIPPPIPTRNPARISRVQPIPKAVVPPGASTNSRFAPTTFVPTPASWFPPVPAPKIPQSRGLRRLVDKALGRIDDVKDWFRRHRNWANVVEKHRRGR